MAARTDFYNDLEDYPNSTFLYDEDYNDEVCDTTSVVEFASVVTPAFFSMVITLSLAGNILVLVILAKYENLKSLTNIFILNLAISDLVFTFGLPFWASYHIWGWTFGWILCKTVNFVFYTGFYSSILFLTVMTFHRYLAVVYPLSDHGSQRGCYGVTVSLVIWMVSFGVAVPALIFSSVQNHVHDKGYRLYCEYNDLNWRNVSSYQQMVFFLGAFMVMGFCYIMILKTVFRSRSHMRTRTVKLIFSIVAVFFLGWAPYNVVILLMLLTKNNTCDSNKILDYGLSVCRLIAFSHCCLNPVFYAFVGTKFRKHLQSILQKCFHRRSTMEAQQNRPAIIPSMGSMY
ncbi:chemokine XC receptor 1 isoform X2 [Esox lucius]|uniref:G-protein coupled receptors family 1 profile domain-containing protein n=1 Tax=Esox lucius TaxID=8010 RepID=A0A3P8XE78_ESOLU|nr:chemokine XC receptor 1 isoform X2 [Esox lucius]